MIWILFVWKVVLISQTLNVHILALTIVSIENIILINRVWTFILLNISLFLIFKHGLIVFLIYQLGLAFVSSLELVISLIFFNIVNMVNQMVSNDRLEDILVGKTQCQILLVLIILWTLHHHIVLLLLEYHWHFLHLLNPLFGIFGFVAVFKISLLHVELNFIETYMFMIW